MQGFMKDPFGMNKNKSNNNNNQNSNPFGKTNTNTNTNTSSSNNMNKSMHDQAQRTKCMECPKEVLEYIQVMRRDFYQAKNILTGFTQTDSHGHTKQHLQGLEDTKNFIISEVTKWFDDLHMQMESHARDNNQKYSDKVQPLQQEVDYNIQMLDDLEKSCTKYENMESVHQVMHMMLYDDTNSYDPDVTMEKVNSMVQDFVQGQYAVQSDQTKIQQTIKNFQDCVKFDKIDGEAFMKNLKAQRSDLDAKGISSNMGDNSRKANAFAFNSNQGQQQNKYSQPSSNYNNQQQNQYNTPSPATNRLGGGQQYPQTVKRM